MAPTTTVDTPSKDPSKMSKTEFLRLYKTTVAEKEAVAKKYGKVQRKYKCVKRALETAQDSDELEKGDKIPYPTGETPGRGDCHLLGFLPEISKEEYNAFIALIHQAMAAAGIPNLALWQNVRAGPLADVLDVIREQYPWLERYDNDWPTTTIMKQYLRNNRNSFRRKACDAAVNAATNATANATTNAAAATTT